MEEALPDKGEGRRVLDVGCGEDEISLKILVSLIQVRYRNLVSMFIFISTISYQYEPCSNDSRVIEMAQEFGTAEWTVRPAPLSNNSSL